MVTLNKAFPVREFAPIKRAMISVSDKSELTTLGKALREMGVEIVSTGGSFKALADARIDAIEVASLTGFPELLDGRVKTLHPAIHGGILAVRDDPEHAKALAAQGIGAIDLVVVNLYPFEETVARGALEAEIVENIDIGGPALIRAAAKNHAYVTVVVDPSDYGAVLEAMTENKGAVPFSIRRDLAAKAYARTAAYDSAVANWFAARGRSDVPRWRSFAGTLRETLRYGENPHQKAALYLTGEKRPGVATARQLQGKELSYINITDAEAAFELVAEFDPKGPVAAAIVKHGNPCGMALGATAAEAYRLALRCDPVSRFGGIIAVNRTLDAKNAAAIVEIFTEVIIAPDVSEEARAILAAKKNIRVLVTGALPDPNQPGVTVRSVAGGLLVQDRDVGVVDQAAMRTVTKRQPTDAEYKDLLFAYTVCKHVKSNAIVLAKDQATVGIGAGQMSRVDSSFIAARKAGEAAAAAGLDGSLAEGCVAASDAFFPFPDGVITLADAGATAVIQPGGAMGDNKVIAAADERGLAMIFTGMRHFRH
jgi:phosphoribosylaminoimidazolecarboxamide formyltransferase/IMP cyclohydrolase